MARASDNKGYGWEFVSKGAVLQYKEDWYIAIVEIIEDNSDKEHYNFRVRVLAANSRMLTEFGVIAAKGFMGSYSGMCQFFEHPEYIPLPLGSKWEHIIDEEKTKAFMGETVQEVSR